MNKIEYWNRRKGNKRGQGEYPKPKFYSKGERVTYTNRDGHEAEYPNDLGSHVMGLGKGARIVNRKEYRRWKYSK